MSKKEWKQTLFVFGLILLVALVKDLTVSKIEKGGILYREEAGGEGQEIDLIAEIEGMEDEYSYHLVIDAVDFTKEEAELYISQAMQIIETDFGEIDSKLPIAKTYVSDMVEAEWFFSPVEYVKKDGSIDHKSIIVMRGLHKSLDKEAIRIIKKMPKWKPGEDFNGQAIDYKYIIPVEFKLNKETANP